MFIVMAIQEEGSEIRVSDWDPTPRGFESREEANRVLEHAREYYPEFRRFWVEELRDSTYWLSRDDLDEYGNDLNEYF